MKILQKTGYTFAPASRALDFAGLAGFDVRDLFAIINLASADTIYVAGAEGLGYVSMSGAKLTLTADTSAMSAADPLLVLYDDGTPPASAPLQTASNALLTSILAAFPALVQGRFPVDSSGVTQPVSAASLPLPAGAATAARQDTAATTLASILAALQAQIDLETSVWTDGTSFYVRRESVGEGTGAITVAFTNPDGSAASPNLSTLRPAASDNAVQLLQSLFDVRTAGTGYVLGDQIARVVAVNKATNPPTASGAIWINLTTGAVIAAPAAANIAETDQNVTAVLAAGSNTIGAVTNLALGAPGDATAGTDTGTFSLVALAKRTLGNWTTLLTRFPVLGQALKAASVPVVLASDQGSLAVGATLQAGTAVAGRFGIDQTTPGTTNGVSITGGGNTASPVSTADVVPAAVDASYRPATSATNALPANAKRAAVYVYNPNAFDVMINFRGAATTTPTSAGNITVKANGGEWRSTLGMCPKTAMSIIAGTAGGTVTIMEGTTP